MPSNRSLDIENLTIEATIKSNNLSGIIVVYIDRLNEEKKPINREIKESIINYIKSENNDGRWFTAAIMLDKLYFNDSLVYNQ